MSLQVRLRGGGHMYSHNICLMSYVMSQNFIATNFSQNEMVARIEIGHTVNPALRDRFRDPMVRLYFTGHWPPIQIEKGSP